MLTPELIISALKRVLKLLKGNGVKFNNDVRYYYARFWLPEPMIDATVMVFDPDKAIATAPRMSSEVRYPKVEISLRIRATRRKYPKVYDDEISLTITDASLHLDSYAAKLLAKIKKNFERQKQRRERQSQKSMEKQQPLGD